jgi:Glycosyl transferase family 2
MKPVLTIGVPVYRGERYLSEALDSIRHQTVRNFMVLISIDEHDAVCEEICRTYCKDPRFHMSSQLQRQGWVGNINSLLARVETEYWYFHQQDDVVHPTYVEALLTAAEDRPNAAVTYCNLVPMGRIAGSFEQPPSVLGRSAFERQLKLMREHFPAFAFRGLVRRKALKEAGPIPTNNVNNFGVDITWLAATARWGELWHVEKDLYWKRYHDSNTESEWWAFPRDARVRTWACHCADMLTQALKIDATVSQARLLFLSAVERLWSRCAGHFLPVDELTEVEKAALLQLFLDHVRERSLRDELELSDAHVSRLANDFAFSEAWAGGTIVAYGPDVVTERVPFNVQLDGSSAIWVRMSRRPHPRCQLSLAGYTLDTVVTGKLVTARVPEGILDGQANAFLYLLSPDGATASNSVSIEVRSSGCRRGCLERVT